MTDSTRARECATCWAVVEGGLADLVEHLAVEHARVASDDPDGIVALRMAALLRRQLDVASAPDAVELQDALERELRARAIPN